MDRSTDSTKANDGKIKYENVCLIRGFGAHLFIKIDRLEFKYSHNSKLVN